MIIDEFYKIVLSFTNKGSYNCSLQNRTAMLLLDQIANVKLLEFYRMKLVIIF